MEVNIDIFFYEEKNDISDSRDSNILYILKYYLRSKLTIVGVVSPSPVKISIYI